jgi:DDE superfamily endonuclease
MLDHFKCNPQTTFFSSLSQLGCDVDYISAGYTCVMQPCDVGANAPLKRSILLQHRQWLIKNYAKLKPKQKFPVPERSDIIEWVENAFAQVTVETVRKHF